jgi:hypothetical protein
MLTGVRVHDVGNASSTVRGKELLEKICSSINTLQYIVNQRIKKCEYLKVVCDDTNKNIIEKYNQVLKDLCIETLHYEYHHHCISELTTTYGIHYHHGQFSFPISMTVLVSGYITPGLTIKTLKDFCQSLNAVYGIQEMQKILSTQYADQLAYLWLNQPATLKDYKTYIDEEVLRQAVNLNYPFALCYQKQPLYISNLLTVDKEEKQKIAEIINHMYRKNLRVLSTVKLPKKEDEKHTVVLVPLYHLETTYDCFLFVPHSLTANMAIPTSGGPQPC